MRADAVHFDFMTGRPSMVAGTLRRRVSAYTREELGRRFKIGITINPRVRFSKRDYSGYDEMFVLYKSSSLDSVSEVESDLIDHNQEITKNRMAAAATPVTLRITCTS